MSMGMWSGDAETKKRLFLSVFHDFYPVFDRFQAFLTIFQIKKGQFYRFLLVIRALRRFLRHFFPVSPLRLSVLA